MPDVTITPTASTSVTIGGAPVTDVSLGVGSLIEKKFFQSVLAPASNVNQGDLWYDMTLSKLKLRGVSSWDKIGGASEELDGEYFRFTSDSTISSGNIAEFRNNSTNSLFSVRHDGVLIMKDQSSAPTAVANGLYSDGVDLFHGIE